MKCNPNFVFREVHGKFILVPFRRNELGNEPIHLNDVAAVIWKNTDICDTVDDLLNVITDLYQLEPESAEQNAVRQFIAQLLEMKLISE